MRQSITVVLTSALLIVTGAARGEDSEPAELDYLPGDVLAEIDHGPGVFEVDPADTSTFEPYLSVDDLAFIAGHRAGISQLLLHDLEQRGSRLAALLLAWLGERQALGELRRRLLTESDRYGWETSYPTLFAEGDHRGYHAYSRAIEHLSGVPLEQALRLSDEEVAALAARADGTALILLHRLAPEVARERVLALFRAARASPSCLEPANTIHEHGYLAPGTPRDVAFALLGSPDRLETADPDLETAYYCCGVDDWVGHFRLRLAGDRAVAFESEYRDSDRREPWCADR